MYRGRSVRTAVDIRESKKKKRRWKKEVKKRKRNERKGVAAPSAKSVKEKKGRGRKEDTRDLCSTRAQCRRGCGVNDC